MVFSRTDNRYILQQQTKQKYECVLYKHRYLVLYSNYIISEA